MGVHLPSPITCLYIDLRLIDEPNDLHVVGCFDKLHAPERVVRDEACAASGFGAPRDHIAFHITDDGVGFNGGPEAEVYRKRVRDDY